MSFAKLDATGQRWVSRLPAFDFDIQYRWGRSNANADALSRMSSQEVTQVLRTCPQRVTTSENERVEALPTQEPGGSPGKTTEDTQPPNPQRPTSSEPYKEVGTESLPAMTKQEIRVGQKEDPVFGPVLHFKSLNQKPNSSERLSGGGQVCLLRVEEIGDKGRYHVPPHPRRPKGSSGAVGVAREATCNGQDCSPR